MSYEVFQSRVNGLIEKAGGGISVRFFQENGKHYAKCSDGTTIIGNSIAPSVKIMWGSGHVANAAI